MQTRLLEQKSKLQFYLNNQIFYNLEPSLVDFGTIEMAGDIDIHDQQQLIDLFYQNILYIRLYIDAMQGVRIFFQKDIDGKRQWVRVVDTDAILEQKSDQTLFTICNYLRVFYSYLLSGLTIATMYHFNSPEFLEVLMHINRNICSSLWASKQKMTEREVMTCLSEGKGYLIETMNMFCDELTKAEINAMLDQAKNWAALEFPSFSICTVLLPSSKTFNHAFALIDDPCCQLTDDQQDLFRNMDTKLWFIELSAFEKKLVLHYKDRIISGRYVVPSQLRATVPVTKNAYLQSIWAAEEGGEFQLINSYYHTGSAAHVSHKCRSAALMITKNNLLQQREVSATDFSLMICLNSQWADTFIGAYEWLFGRLYVPDDSEIVSLTKESSKLLLDEGVRVAKICINQLRMVEYNDYSGIDDVIGILQDNLKRVPLDVDQYHVFMNSLSRLSSARYTFAPLDLYAKGLDIIHELSFAVTISNSLAEKFPKLELKRVSVWFGCASGENRTGIVYYHNIGISLVRYLEGYCGHSLTPLHRDDIFKFVAKSQHLHMMTGNQGNAIGTEGIRYKSSGALRSDHSISDLVTSVSDLKVLPVYNRSLPFLLDNLHRVIQSMSEVKTLADLLPVTNLIYNRIKAHHGDPFALSREDMNAIRHFTDALDGLVKSTDQQLSVQKLMTTLESIFKPESLHRAASSPLFLELNPLFEKMAACLQAMTAVNAQSQLIAQGLFAMQAQTVSTMNYAGLYPK